MQGSWLSHESRMLDPFLVQDITCKQVMKYEVEIQVHTIGSEDLSSFKKKNVV